MNSLRASLRVKLGLANPCTHSYELDEIKAQHRIFQTAKDNKATVTLMDRHQINYDTHILTFRLPQDNKCLGIKNGEYVWIGINGQSRPYVPISPIDQPETVDFLIRDLSAKNPNSFSSSLLGLKVNGEA